MKLTRVQMFLALAALAAVAQAANTDGNASSSLLASEEPTDSTLGTTTQLVDTSLTDHASDEEDADATIKDASVTEQPKQKTLENVLFDLNISDIKVKDDEHDLSSDGSINLDMTDNTSTSSFSATSDSRSSSDEQRDTTVQQSEQVASAANDEKPLTAQERVKLKHAQHTDNFGTSLEDTLVKKSVRTVPLEPQRKPTAQVADMNKPKYKSLQRNTDKSSLTDSLGNKASLGKKLTFNPDGTVAEVGTQTTVDDLAQRNAEIKQRREEEQRVRDEANAAKYKALISRLEREAKEFETSKRRAEDEIARLKELIADQQLSSEDRKAAALKRRQTALQRKEGGADMNEPGKVATVATESEAVIDGEPTDLTIDATTTHQPQPAHDFDLSNVKDSNLEDPRLLRAIQAVQNQRKETLASLRKTQTRLKSELDKLRTPRSTGISSTHDYSNVKAKVESINKKWVAPAKKSTASNNTFAGWSKLLKETDDVGLHSPEVSNLLLTPPKEQLSTVEEEDEDTVHREETTHSLISTDDSQPSVVNKDTTVAEPIVITTQPNLTVPDITTTTHDSDLSGQSTDEEDSVTSQPEKQIGVDHRTARERLHDRLAAIHEKHQQGKALQPVSTMDEAIIED